MTTTEDADRRIDRREKELAKLQTEETTYRQLEANLEFSELKKALNVATVIATVAHEVIESAKEKPATSACLHVNDNEETKP